MRINENNIRLVAIILSAGAIVLCSSCNAGFDNSRVKSLNIEARTYYQEGVELSRENRTGEAIQAFTKSIESGPGAAAYGARAAEYYRMGRIDEAIADANRAIMLSEKYAPAYFTRGNSYYKKGDYNRALKDFSRSIILDPAQPRCYFNLAQTYTKLGLSDEAIDMYGKAVERDPGYYPAHYNRACLYAQKNERDRALESLERAIKNGLCNPELLRREQSFDALRKTARFRQLSDRLDRSFKSSGGCRQPKPE